MTSLQVKSQNDAVCEERPHGGARELAKGVLVLRISVRIFIVFPRRRLLLYAGFNVRSFLHRVRRVPRNLFLSKSQVVLIRMNRKDLASRVHVG